MASLPHQVARYLVAEPLADHPPHELARLLLVEQFYRALPISRAVAYTGGDGELHTGTCQHCQTSLN